MAEYSRFFGGPVEAIPEYVQPQFAEVLAKLFSNGVFSGIDNELEVTEHDPLALAVDIDTGEGWINGFWYQNTGEGTPPILTKSLGAADPDNPRIDRIVLRLDTVTNFKISCEVLEGTPATEPTPPELTQTAAIYEISLAQVYIAAEATYVSNANITDEREFAGVPNADKVDDYDLVPDIAGGWFPTGETWAYASWDADVDTGVITVPSGAASKYSAGMKIKITQTTGGVKYGIITKVADTTLTIYFGTDYTLNNEAVTLPYYSTMKAPLGFPLDPIKWTVEVTDAVDRPQATPTANTWYNPGAISIDIPIGAWSVEYDATPEVRDATVALFTAYITLSTANNSESDNEFTRLIYPTFEPAAADSTLLITGYKRKPLTLATKTAYYLNIKTGSANIDEIAIRGDFTKTIIRAVCTYL